ncbi:MAG: hypothetical protein ACQGVK_01955 [Myxococcota bacterium]
MIDRDRRLARRLALVLVLASTLALAAGCKPALKVFIDSPTYGEFVTAPTVTVTGRFNRNPTAFTSFTVNGVPVVDVVGMDWSVDIPVSAADVFTWIEAEAVFASGTSTVARTTVQVVNGVTSQALAIGQLESDAVGLRIGNTGLDQIAPVVESLSGDALDISDLITGQNPIAQGSFSGINYTANAVEVSFGGFSLDTAAAAGGLDTTITIEDFYVELDLDLGFLGSCTLEIQTASSTIAGDFDLQPLASDPSFVDVNLVSTVQVGLGGFDSEFVSGICDDPLLGDIINLVMSESDLQNLMQDGFRDNLADPDGAGPADSPLADAIEEALAGVSIAGPLGDALGGVVEAEISDVAEDADGLTLVADASIYSTSPLPETPPLTETYALAETFPTFGATTPVGGLPYGTAFAISTTALNQLLAAQIQNGLLRDDITEFAFGGGAPVNLTTTVLGLFIPELFGVSPPEELTIEVRPRLAPVFTGQPGPNGELAEMKVGGLGINVVNRASGDLYLSLEVQVDLGVDMSYGPDGLAFSIGTVSAADVDVLVTFNLLLSDEASIIAAMEALFPVFAPALQDSLGAFPVPGFLGLELAPVEVTRMGGGYLGLFADLQALPSASIENVVFSDFSTGDFRQQGGCWLREWRHRLAGQSASNFVSANMRGMLGADAGCTTNDASSDATASYRIEFDVVAVPGEQWTLDVDHSIFGALGLISDGYNDGIGFQDGSGYVRFQTDVLGSATVDGGTPIAFDFTPSVTNLEDPSIGGSSSTLYAEFTGAAGTQITGTADSHVVLDFSFGMRAHSNSNTAFPTANGDETGIRLGKNDTIDNNFTVGGYPGLGNRNIADDGHVVGVSLSSAPLP